MDEITAARDDVAPHDPLRALLHRWFVQYNPLALFSACLVLGGMFFASRELPAGEVMRGSFGLGATAELYSVALIGGAAVLMRAAQKRSAVLLGLLAVFYQFDLTLLTETAPSFGLAGAISSTVWMSCFSAKLVALAWALRLRLSTATLFTAMFAAAGLALLPHVLQEVSPRGRTTLITSWWFALSFAQQRSMVVSRVELDDWGQTVLRRAVLATWIIGGVLVGLHVLFWAASSRVEILPLLLVLPLLFMRATQSERRLWCVVLSTLVGTAAIVPETFSATALIAAAAFAARVNRSFSVRVARVDAEGESTSHYRVPHPDADAHDAARTCTKAPTTFITSESARARLVVGALGSAYLSLWTAGWTGGSWPAHELLFDCLLTAALLVSFFRMRSGWMFTLLAGMWGHAVLSLGLVPVPQTPLEWAVVTIASGFVMLFGSVGITFWLRPRDAVRTRSLAPERADE